MDDWTEIDYEGLEHLENICFFRYEDMIFRKGAYDEASITKLLGKGESRTAIQWIQNHQSLISYGGSLEDQRNAALRIAKIWSERATEEFPSLYITVTLEMMPDEVILSTSGKARDYSGDNVHEAISCSD